MTTAPVPATQPDTTGGGGGDYAPKQAVTLTISSDLIGRVAHGYLAGDTVSFSDIATTTGIDDDSIYFVIASGLTADVFKVSTTLGGSTVNLATGDGTAKVHLVGRAYSAPSTHRTAQSASDVDTTKTNSGAFSDQYATVQAVTLTDTGDLVGKAAHGYVAGDPVVFSDIVSTTGLTAGTVYYVIASGLTSSVFKVSATLGGSAVTLTTDGTANVHKVITTEHNGVIVSTNVDTGAKNTLGLDGSAYDADPVYDAVSIYGEPATQPDSTVGGGSLRTDANPVYRAPAGPVAATNFVTAIPDAASFSGFVEHACTFTDAGDLVGVVAHGYVAGDAVVFDDIVTTTGLSEGQRYYVIASGLTADAFKVSISVGGSAVALTTNGTGTVQRTTTSTDVSGNVDMTQVGAVADTSGGAVPVAPTGVTATALANGEVRVAWTAPAQISGANRIGYYVESSLGMSLYVAGNAVTVDIQAWRVEADNQQSQTFTVRAVNKNGSGPKSTASAAVDLVNINQGYGTLDFPDADIDPVYLPSGDVVDGSGDIPNAPTGVSATPFDAFATVIWTDPSVGAWTGFTVTAYKVSDDSVVTTATVGDVNTADVTGLTNATAVYFKVVALNDAEDSPASAASAPVTPLAVPTAPTLVAGTSGVSLASSISWTPGVGGGAASSFDVFVALASAPTVAVAGTPTNDAASPLLVTGLTNAAHVAKVRGRNASGPGPYSTLSASFTPAA